MSNATMEVARPQQSTAIAKPQTLGDHLAVLKDQQRKFHERMDSLAALLDGNKHRIFSAVPAGYSADRMIRIVVAAVRKNPKLLECNPASLFNAVTDAATMGWEVGGFLGQAYLVPFSGEVQMIPGYKGLLDLCNRSGRVQTINRQVVRQGDRFEYTLGDEPKIVHVPNDSDPDREKKPITHAYVVAKLNNGGTVRDVWTIARLHEHRDRYSAGYRKAAKYLEECTKANRTPDESKLSPWQTAEAAMCQKTVLRSMINGGMIPLSVEIRDLINQKAIIEDSIGSDVLEVQPSHPSQDVDLLPPPADDEPASLDPLDGVKERFEAFTAVKDAEALYTSLCGPNSQAGVDEEGCKLVNQWYDAARERITGKKPRQSR